jgi:hypothetical protein
MSIPNSEKYFFSDFTRENYRKLLQIAKKKYKFLFYDETDGQTNFVLWRHDIDFSPQSARRLAQIEADEGLKATYFLLPHSDFYNLLEKEIVQCIRDIVNLGHDIGLHFDAGFYNIDNTTSLAEKIFFEKDLIREVFKVEPKVFSFHNPDVFELNCTDDKYAGLINTYSLYFKKELGYCSDSNGYWRYDRLEDVLISGKHNSLQVLTHPEWWQDDIMSPRERVLRCLKGRSEKNFNDYDALLKRMNRENIDW